jgi:hypothetical protein
MMSQCASDEMVEILILSIDMKGLGLDHDTNVYVCLFLAVFKSLENSMQYPEMPNGLSSWMPPMAP